MAREPELREARLTNLEASQSEAVATTTTQGLEPAANFAAYAPPVASVTALAAIATGSRADGMICLVQSDASGAASHWQFSAASAATDTTKNLVVAPSAGSGAWLRVPGLMALSLACDHTTADAAALFTMPTGAKFHVLDAWWDVLVSWTGGSTPAIGVHCSVSGWSTKGDILGGGSGDLTATLVSSATRMTGTIGAKMDTRTHGRLIMVAADTLNFDRIADNFAAGSANVRVFGHLIANPGA